MKEVMWKVVWWFRYKSFNWVIGLPRRNFYYQIYKTTKVEKAIFISSYLIGLGIATDYHFNLLEYFWSVLFWGNLFGWFLLGFWRWFLRNFTPRGF